jgi:glycosyltransferase involved in cell wall biosynthesis
MKILQINKFFYLRGGSERYLFDVSSGLKKLGHQVVNFSMKDGRNWPSEQSRYFAESVAFERFSWLSLWRFIYNRQAMRRLERLLLAEKPDIAHLHNIAHQLTPGIIKVLKKHGVPVIQTLHDYKLICPNYRLFAQGSHCESCRHGHYYQCTLKACVKDSRAKSFLATLEAYWNNSFKKYYHSVDLFIAPSRYMAEAVERFGWPVAKVRVLYNFTDLPAVEPAGQGDYLLYFGRLSAEKGLDSLLEALVLLPERQLIIAGAGPDYKKLESAISRLGLEARVRLAGPKFGEELAELLSEAEAVIFPSVWAENMPLSLIEAMRQGKVCLVSRVGGMPELITDGQNGFIFAPGNPASLVEAVKRSEKSDKRVIGQAASLRVAELISQKHLSELIKIYQEVILANNK